ncbi:MAG: hypothetical protein OXI73_16565 [Rhodospirillales bacterium]|nr:hypothetical protein [Rhodospirillales bacterium]
MAEDRSCQLSGASVRLVTRNEYAYPPAEMEMASRREAKKPRAAFNLQTGIG